MQEEILRPLWENEIKILDEFVRICDKYDLQYYLLWGTLLGAVRHGGFIPWDDDVDVAMPRKEYKKFLKLAKDELSNDFFLQTNLTDKYHPTHFAKIRLNNTAFYASNNKNLKKHHGIFIDIFPLDERKGKVTFIRKVKNRIASKINDYVYNKREGLKYNKLFTLFPTRFLIGISNFCMKGKGEIYTTLGKNFNKKDFYPSIKMRFCDKEYSVPSGYHNVLTSLYGDYMQLPPVDKRVAHLPAFISFDLDEDKVELEKYLKTLTD